MTDVREYPATGTRFRILAEISHWQHRHDTEAMHPRPRTATGKPSTNAA